MKRKDIEKAAGDYSGSILGFTDNKSVMEKHKAFADGAEWFRKSLFHKTKNEVPKIIGEYADEFAKGFEAGWDACLKHLGEIPWDEAMNEICNR